MVFLVAENIDNNSAVSVTSGFNLDSETSCESVRSSSQNMVSSASSTTMLILAKNSAFDLALQADL